MQVTLRANCWDGARQKSLMDIAKVEGLKPVADSPSFLGRIGEAARDPKVKALLGFSVPLMFLASGLPPIGLSRAFAATMHSSVTTTAAVTTAAASAEWKTTVLHAFDPLIDLIQSLSYPIAGVMIAGGCLFIMVGNREKGMQMLQNAAIGYILVQLSPMLLKLLVGVGDAV